MGVLLRGGAATWECCHMGVLLHVRLSVPISQASCRVAVIETPNVMTTQQLQVYKQSICSWRVQSKTTAIISAV